MCLVSNVPLNKNNCISNASCKAVSIEEIPTLWTLNGCLNAALTFVRQVLGLVELLQYSLDVV